MVVPASLRDARHLPCPRRSLQSAAAAESALRDQTECFLVPEPQRHAIPLGAVASVSGIHGPSHEVVSSYSDEHLASSFSSLDPLSRRAQVSPNFTELDSEIAGFSYVDSTMDAGQKGHAYE